MSDFWLSIKDLPEQGREFEVSDQEVWTVPIREFNIQASITRNLHARFSIFPGQNGYLIRGVLRGAVKIPCDRCSAAEEIGLDAAFEFFEESGPVTDKGFGGQSILRFSQGLPEINAGAMLWEQFLLTQPIKHLCSDKCQGLCPKCGQNLNLADCGCDRDEADPRMAIFRNLKINT
ncbi:MAG: DUF177 domain-containing protein [Desulfohalobiaceae bacterium]|nr:DUF177 domain-containing protein [Desulfohalobiaceae bacterium]